jgi:hypothetical protein
MADNNNDRVAELPLDPHPAMQQLAPLLGKWRNEGGAPGTSEYKWALNGHFFTQEFETVTPSGRHLSGIEYITWDEATQSLRSHLMADDGSNFTYTYQLDNDGTVWTWFGEKDSDNFFKGKFNVGGTVLAGRWQWPGGGFDATSVRLSA